MIKKSSISVIIVSLLLILILGFILGYQIQKQHVLKNSANIEKVTDSENESVLLYSEDISKNILTNNDTIQSTLSDDIANSENTLSVDITPNSEDSNINETATTENSVSNNIETNQPATNTKDKIENSDEIKQDNSNKDQSVYNPPITEDKTESTIQNSNSNMNIIIREPNNNNSKPVIEGENKQTTNENKPSTSTPTVNNTDTKPSTTNPIVNNNTSKPNNNNISSNVNISNSTNSSSNNSNNNVEITITNKNETVTPNTNTSTNVIISTGDSISEIETLIFNKINEERSKVGLSKLQNSSTAAKYAKEKSKDMATRNYFDHYSPEGHLVYNKMVKDGVKFTSWAENLGYISSSNGSNYIASALMNSWMNSPGHKANILSTAYSHVGIGVYKINGEIYATQEFLSF